jgi:hypothetical protein
VEEDRTLSELDVVRGQLQTYQVKNKNYKFVFRTLCVSLVLSDA